MGLDLTLSSPGQCLTSYALLNTFFWDNESPLQGTYKALFPLLVAALRHTVGDVVTVDEVSGNLTTVFGLTFPRDVIGGMLKTASREGLLLKRSTEGGVTFLTVDREVLAGLPDIEAIAGDLRREHGLFIHELREFSRERFGQAMSRAEAEGALHGLLLERIDQISALQDYANVVSEWSLEMSPSDAGYILGRFIEEEVTPGTDLHAYMTRIVRGSALAVAVFYRGDQVQRLASSMKGLQVYFDTPLVLSLLGRHKPEDQAAVADVLRLVKLSGAVPCVFEHTCDELRNVLLGAVQDMKNAQHGQALESRMPVVETFVREALSSEEAISERDTYILEAERLPEILRGRYGFHIERLPPRGPEEEPDKLRSILREKYASDPSRRLIDYDVHSLLGVDRIRRGRLANSLSDARAVFITSNPKLTEAANVHFGHRPGSGHIPPCYTSDAFVNLLWLKRPLDLPDVPWRQVVSYVYAGLYPGEELWRKYTKFLDNLKQREHPITDEDYFILRFTVGARQALMDDTLGRPDLLTVGAITDILAKARSSLTSDMQDQLDSAQEELNARIAQLTASQLHLTELERSIARMEDEWRAAAARADALQARDPLERLAIARDTLNVESRVRARRERRILEAVALLAIVTGFGSALVSGLGRGLPIGVGFGVAVLGLTASWMGFRNISSGWSFSTFEEARVARHTKRRLARLLRRVEAAEGRPDASAGAGPG